METKKLSMPTDQRNAMLRGLVTDLLWHGKIDYLKKLYCISSIEGSIEISRFS